MAIYQSFPYYLYGFEHTITLYYMYTWEKLLHQIITFGILVVTDSPKFSQPEFCAVTNSTVSYIDIHAVAITSPGVVIITTPASPLPIELVATTENV